jgi:hypothetical protein
MNNTDSLGLEAWFSDSSDRLAANGVKDIVRKVARQKSA